MEIDRTSSGVTSAQPEALFEYRLCPLCQNQDYTVLRRATYPSNLSRVQLAAMYSASSEHQLMDQLVRCKACQLVYLNPQVKSDLVVEGYKDAVDPVFIKQNPLRIDTFRRNFAAVCARIGLGDSRARRVLDVGCAGGAFPQAAHELGFSVVGVEPSRWLSEHARQQYQLDIRTGLLDEQSFESHSFDVVTLWDVLEHVAEPAKMLATVRSLLKDDGHLLLSYPDGGSIAARILGKRWPFYLSVHLVYFTPHTLRRFLDQLGYDVLLLRPYWQTLQLGYVTDRAAAYFSPFKLLSKLLRSLGLDSIPLRYNMGQTLVVARPKQ